MQLQLLFKASEYLLQHVIDRRSLNDHPLASSSLPPSTLIPDLQYKKKSNQVLNGTAGNSPGTNVSKLNSAATPKTCLFALRPPFLFENVQ